MDHRIEVRKICPIINQKASLIVTFFVATKVTTPNLFLQKREECLGRVECSIAAQMPFKIKTASKSLSTVWATDCMNFKISIFIWFFIEVIIRHEFALSRITFDDSGRFTLY